MNTAKEINKEQVYKDYYEKVLRLCSFKISNTADAEDLTSKIFLKVYEKLDSFDQSKASLSTWIYTIANNSIIDYYRCFKYHVEIQEDLATDKEIDEDLLNDETLSELAAALKKLPERERMIVVLRYYEDKTLKDIAVTLGMSYANTKLLHQKALMTMKKYLQ